MMKSKVDEETLNNMDVVKGTFSTGDSIKSLDLGLLTKYLMN